MRTKNYACPDDYGSMVLKGNGPCGGTDSRERYLSLFSTSAGMNTLNSDRSTNDPFLTKPR
jgi:hypothetical protein